MWGDVMEKLEWEGMIVSVQPRIRLNRSFDERSHSYLGYSLLIDGAVNGINTRFSVGIGKAAQARNQFQINNTAKGKVLPVPDPRKESVDYYKASALSITSTPGSASKDGPPWHGIPPSLEDYRARGHRRLAARTYQTNCASCIWGCNMPVIITVDHWNPGQQRYRFETFCYGPKSCVLYRSGPTRKVPGRSGLSWEEEDWVDEDATAHRSFDE